MFDVLGTFDPRRNRCNLGQKQWSHAVYIKLLHVPATSRAESKAKVRIAVEAKNSVPKFLGTFRFHEKSVPDDLRDGRRSCSDNWLAGSHGLQEHDSKTFLNAGQAKNIRSIVFLSESRKWHITKPAHGTFEVQFAADLAQSPGFWTVADYSNLKSRNRVTQPRRSLKENFKTLSRIKPAYRQNDESVHHARIGTGKQLAPRAQVDQFRNHDGARHAI